VKEAAKVLISVRNARDRSLPNVKIGVCAGVQHDASLHGIVVLGRHSARLFRAGSTTKRAEGGVGVLDELSSRKTKEGDGE